MALRAVGVAAAARIKWQAVHLTMTAATIMTTLLYQYHLCFGYHCHCHDDYGHGFTVSTSIILTTLIIATTLLVASKPPQVLRPPQDLVALPPAGVAAPGRLASWLAGWLAGSSFGVLGARRASPGLARQGPASSGPSQPGPAWPSLSLLRPAPAALHQARSIR